MTVARTHCTYIYRLEQPDFSLLACAIFWNFSQVMGLDTKLVLMYRLFLAAFGYRDAKWINHARLLIAMS